MTKRSSAALWFVLIGAACAHAQSLPETATPRRGTISVNSLVVPARAREKLLKAADSYHKHDFQQSWKQINTALEIAPDYPEALSFRGFLELNNNRIDASMDDLQHALRRDPALASANLHMGSLLNHLGRFDEALTHLARYAELTPNSWACSFEMAKSWLGKQDYVRALEAADRASLQGGAVTMGTSLHLLRGDALFNLHKYDEALSELELYLATEPDGKLAAVARELQAKIKSPPKSDGTLAAK